MGMGKEGMTALNKAQLAAPSGQVSKPAYKTIKVMKLLKLKRSEGRGGN